MRRLLALVCTLSLLALVGCSGSPAPATSPEPSGETAAPKEEEQITITYWHTYNSESNENKVLNEVVIPAFEKKYPNIKINAVVQPYDGLHDSLVTAVASGTTPDIMRMDIIWTPEFAKLGALEPLDEYEGFAELRDSVFRGNLATNIYDGKHYGLPLDTNTQIVIYNPEFLAAAGLSAPPKTFDEFVQYLKTFNGKDGKYGLALNSTSAWQMLPFFWSLGGKITNDDYTQATGYLNSDASVAALETLFNLYKEGALAPTMLGEQPSTWEGYKAGLYGAVLEGPWFFSAMMNDLGDKMQGGLLPAGPGGSLSVVGGENIVMFKTAKHKDAAWKFIQFVLSDEAQEAMIPTGQMPVTRSASSSAPIKESGYFETYVEQLETALPRTPVASWTKIESILNTAFESVFREQSSAREALDQAAAQIDPLLAQ